MYSTNYKRVTIFSRTTYQQLCIFQLIYLPTSIIGCNIANEIREAQGRDVLITKPL